LWRRAPILQGSNRLHTFLVRPISRFGLSLVTRFIDSSHPLRMRNLPSLHAALRLAAPPFLSSPRRTSFEKYIVPGASDPTVTHRACPGRQLLVAQQVTARHAARDKTEMSCTAYSMPLDAELTTIRVARKRRESTHPARLFTALSAQTVARKRQLAVRRADLCNNAAATQKGRSPPLKIPTLAHSIRAACPSTRCSKLWQVPGTREHGLF